VAVSMPIWIPSIFRPLASIKSWAMSFLVNWRIIHPVIQSTFSKSAS